MDDDADRETLLASIAEIRGDIAQTVARIEELNQQVIPQIKTDFWVKIGVWRVRLLKEQLAARRAKRRYAMARASMNSNKPIDGEAIDKALDREFADWRRQVAEQAKSMDAWLRRRDRSSPMHADKARELKRLFRKLARRLHPDLYPGDRKRAEYYAMAQHALADGSLDMLRALDAATMDMTDDERFDGLTDDELRMEIELLNGRLDAVRDRLLQLTSTEPYTLAERLRDPEWVSGQVAGLRGRIDECMASRRHYDGRYEDLLNEERKRR
ncbi:hypothetical protein KIH77_10160 [Bifidobacterium sp. 82T24]|uniref:hypothetical protein n=1 Tax=Bifidobacterium pluvialisilvae TaxID=2834436 RepID=UPI001C56C97F|nr:hypothetical protein [Bifidobacterium pluvialisilvae]MBW3089074.1 hypothetical protein [Bifidobacterium pluvialisilvae]